jgi:hypothetical protein
MFLSFGDEETLNRKNEVIERLQQFEADAHS